MPSTHLVLIPSYNSGELLYRTIEDARSHWSPVWVVIDGSTDGTADGVRRMAENDDGLRVQVLDQNQGKGAALLHGLEAAAAEGFSHALTMDGDGQHPADSIREFMAASARNLEAMILGRPIFDEAAPQIRVQGRRISNWWTHLETLGAGIDDVLFGFRVYPIRPLVDIMTRTRWMRRFDFDTEAVVRLAWRGVEPINIAAPVTYPDRTAGGVSHFRYGRDNCLLTWMHTRLVLEFLIRLPALIRDRVTTGGEPAVIDQPLDRR